MFYWSFPSSSFLCFFPPHSSHILFHSSLWCLYAFHICIENILHSSLPPHLALNVFRGAHFPVPDFASALSAHQQLGESRGHICSSDSAHYRVAQEQNTFHFFCLSPTQRMKPAPLHRKIHTGFIKQNRICPFSCVVGATENVTIKREIK